AERQRLVQRLLEVDGVGVIVVAQHEVVVIEHLAQLRGEALSCVEVLDADGAARHLVLVRGADAAARRADLRLALGALARLVDGDVVREDERARLRDAQLPLHVHAGALELADLRHQRLGRDHDAVADEALHVAVEDPRGDEAKDRLLALDDERVAGVVAALEAHDRGHVVREPVDDLALALVAPLGTDDDYVTRHLPSFFSSFRVQPSSSRHASVPGISTTTTAPAPRSFAIASFKVGSSSAGARIFSALSGLGASAASCRRSIVNPVAGRARPKEAPTSS